MVDPTQGHNHAKFESPPLNNECQKTNVKAFVKSENTSLNSSEYKQK